MIVLLAVWAAGCNEATTTTFDHCEVQGALEPAAAAPGDEVVIGGGPFTEAYDTSVQLDGVDAAVLDVSREGCDECDDCQLELECESCAACPECAEWCAECVEEVRFEVPDLEPGPVDVVLVNRWGSTPTMVLEVTEVDE